MFGSENILCPRKGECMVTLMQATVIVSLSELRNLFLKTPQNQITFMARGGMQIKYNSRNH
jgi:hypothetical protein